MSSSNLIRWSGLAAVLAGAMYAGQGIVDLFAPQQAVFGSPSDYLIEVMFAVALFSTLVGIAGLHALQRESYGRLGMGGSLVALTGHALMFTSAAATAVAGRDVLGALFFGGFFAAVLGLVLLGAATLRAQVLPRWCGVVLIAGFPLSVVFAESGGGVLLGISWALVGYALLYDGSALAHRSVRAA